MPLSPRRDLDRSAIGIGVNTMVLTWVQMVRWQPIAGVADAASRAARRDRAPAAASTSARRGREYRDLQRRLAPFPSLLAFRMAPLTIGDAADVERAYGLFVSGNYFASLALARGAGRLLRAEDADAAWQSSGRRHLARLLADPFRGARRPSTLRIGSTASAHHRWRRPGAVPGHRAGPRV